METHVEGRHGTTHGRSDVSADARNKAEKEATDRTNHDVQENDQMIDRLLESVSKEHIDAEGPATSGTPQVRQTYRQREYPTPVWQ